MTDAQKTFITSALMKNNHKRHVKKLPEPEPWVSSMAWTLLRADGFFQHQCRHKTKNLVMSGSRSGFSNQMALDHPNSHQVSQLSSSEHPQLKEMDTIVRALFSFWR